MKLKRNKLKTKKRKRQNNSVSSEEENEEKYDQLESTIIESNTVIENE